MFNLDIQRADMNQCRTVYMNRKEELKEFLNGPTLNGDTWNLLINRLNEANSKFHHSMFMYATARNLNNKREQTKMYVIAKMEYVGGSMCKERMRIKSFKSSDAMHTFLNKQYDNHWKESKHMLKSGLYACAGGQWHNVKSLDASALAHI